jgi:phosphopantothenoylcysteine synthetase/decarboxylase
MNMNKVLVTAGNTRIPIDRVRGIDNIFKGKTGAAIASYFAKKGCNVTLLTSHPKLVAPEHNLNVIGFDTYDSLVNLMELEIKTNTYGVVIHSAAVSDYRVEGTYRQIGESVDVEGHLLNELAKLDSSGKIGSDHQELWMKLVPTIKIVDQIRSPWRFHWTLVKFKLQVGMSNEELIEVATRSMKHSGADFIVANTLEGMNQGAFIISAKGGAPVCVNREGLPAALYKEISV